MLKIYFMLLVFMSPTVSHAHYDWAWIQKYNNSKGENCCGKQDCIKLDPNTVLSTRQGYTLTERGEFIPYSERFISEDGNYWLCTWSDGRRRCFFAPLHGAAR